MNRRGFSAPFMRFHRARPGFAGHKIIWYPVPACLSLPVEEMTAHERAVANLWLEMRFIRIDRRRHREYWRQIEYEQTYFERELRREDGPR